MLKKYKQWISEVLHFCSGHPIILVGCKKDLRHDQRTIEELHKTSQKPVTPEQVCDSFSPPIRHFQHLSNKFHRVRRSARRLAHTSTWSALPEQTRVSAKFSSQPPVPPCYPKRRPRSPSVGFCKELSIYPVDSLQSVQFFHLHQSPRRTGLLTNEIKNA